MKKLIPHLLVVALAVLTPAQGRAVIKIGDTEYANLGAAVAAAESGATISVTESATSNGSIKVDGKEITIEGTDGVVLTQTNPAAFFTVTGTGGSITIKNITLNGAETVNDNTRFEVSNGGSLSFVNVVLDGFTAHSARGIIRALTGTSLSFENTVFENSKTAVADNAVDYDVFLPNDNTSITLKGECSMTMSLGKTLEINGEGLQSTSAIDLYYPSGTAGAVIVKGCQDVNIFNWKNTTNRMLAPAEGNLVSMVYNKVLLINEAEGMLTGTGYANLPTAITNATENAQVILNEDIEISSLLSLDGKTLSIVGRNKNVTLARSNAYLIANKGKVTFKNLTIDGSKLETAENMVFDANGEGICFNIENVVIKNVNTTNQYGLMRSNSGGYWTLKDVTFENCSANNALALVYARNQGCAISGSCTASSGEMSVRVGNITLDATGLASPVKLVLDENGYSADRKLISGCEDASLFALDNDTWELVAADGGLVLSQKPLDMPSFTQTGGTVVNTEVVEVEAGKQVVLTFDVPGWMTLEYQIAEYVFEPAARVAALADEWLKYESAITVEPDKVVNLRATDATGRSAESRVMVLTHESVLTGVSDMAADAAAPQYYNLNGAPVAADDLVPGIYICRRGAFIQKVVIR